MAKSFLGKQNGWGPKSLRDKMKSGKGGNPFQNAGGDRRLEERKEEMSGN